MIDLAMSSIPAGSAEVPQIRHEVQVAGEQTLKTAIGARSARYERQRMRIIDAAVLLMNEKGVAGMTLQEVAQALGLTTTSVTYYYRYKEQLAAGVFEDTLARLESMVEAAAQECGQRARITRYIEIYFEQFVKAMRGEDRPLALLSEVRTLEEGVRRPLIKRYQTVFRAVRQLFGDVDCPGRKLILSARTQILNEALFWASLWLRRYPFRDLDNVRRRMFEILANGVGAAGARLVIEFPDKPIESSRDIKRDFLGVATRLINDIGYKGASVDKIVSELNITKGSFYHHLDAKDDLIEACYREDYRRFAALKGLLESSPASAAIGLCKITAYALNVQFDGIYPFLRTTALQAMPPSVRQSALERFERNATWLSGVLVDGVAEGSIKPVDPLIAANIIISTLNSAYDMRGWAKHHRRTDAIHIYTHILMNGLLD